VSGRAVIEVVDYDEGWPAQFDVLRERYRAALEQGGITAEERRAIAGMNGR
jgi:GrpB-like predicted nucleotidyltransferase (UPF0157 family)